MILVEAKEELKRTHMEEGEEGEVGEEVGEEVMVVMVGAAVVTSTLPVLSIIRFPCASKRRPDQCQTQHKEETCAPTEVPQCLTTLVLASTQCRLHLVLTSSHLVLHLMDHLHPTDLSPSLRQVQCRIRVFLLRVQWVVLRWLTQCLTLLWALQWLLPKTGLNRCQWRTDRRTSCHRT